MVDYAGDNWWCKVGLVFRRLWICLSEDWYDLTAWWQQSQIKSEAAHENEQDSS